VEALTRPGAPRCHFVANVDGEALRPLTTLNPDTTLFIVVSKSFSTLETRVNAESARSWFLERVPDLAAIGRHFLAVTANVEAAAAFGIPEDNIYPLWDWVGGRFSLWSAVGMPVALVAGHEGFQELLRGAHAMDTHFRTAAPARNGPLLMALLGIWNSNFLGATNHAVLPYGERLRLLPAYLQQLEMESNGKSVHTDGTPVRTHTMSILWGGQGTNGQHAFHQLLHQGTRSFSADFVICAENSFDGVQGLAEHHRWLLANALAQSQAMMSGQEEEDPHRSVSGDKPTSTLMLDRLSPYSLGALLALYEHKVFCQGVIWDINSFDQWGVELGKRLAQPIFEQLGGRPALGQDASTRGLIDHLRRRSTDDDT
jgi:glucose-6-phosphate isomerase